MDQIPLSFNQQFMCEFDQGDEAGPFGPHHHVVHGWRLRGEVAVDTMRAALDDVVTRHEALRTEIVRYGGSGHQRVLPPQPVTLETRDLSYVTPADRDEAATELITEVESGTISAGELPPIRGLLGRFDDDDHILVLIVHHIAADGWSVRLVIRDFAHRYAVRRGLDVGELPPARPYREYAVRQRASVTEPAVESSREYWRDALRGGRIFSLPTDYPKSAGIPESTAVYRFLIDTEVVTAVLEIARLKRCTPFMVLLAGFTRLVQRISDTNDVVVPTFTPGRSEEEFQETVGLFLNLLPVRIDLDGCRDFGELVDRVRRSCMDAYSHDHVPTGLILDEAPNLMDPAAEDDRAACVFQAFPFPFLLDGEPIGDLVYTEVRRRLRSQPVGSEVPNGALWTLNFDPEGDVVAAVQFNSNLFHESTIAAMVSEYLTVLRLSVTDPEAPLNR
ncbi:Condensation domain-containing protein [Actinopolyspora lacussalsi subsp. righensis]|uniref:Condensation domain-containing protein n=1 Tax=Actinopolyspora righensis TaxID=995060 RepID=A0A1I6XDS0_9ACTN|nr:condensation domain-containing protein [Actinopolyspora righensis]SFT36192.1 Condensation domain-containing protein [Actinopolyspora righensis]